MASLEELKKRLYKEKESFGERIVPPELARPQRLKTIFWRETAMEAKRSKWFLWSLAAVAILVLLGILFFIFGSPAIFNSERVEIKIEGAKDIKSGDKITWQVRITNKNSSALEDAALIFNFPEGAVPISGQPPKGVFRERRSLGPLRPGESVFESFDAYVFGGRGQSKEVSAVLEYRPKESSAVFASDTAFRFSIARSAVAVSFKIPPDLRIGQQVELEVNYGSQSEETVPNLLLSVFLPEGFEYLSASPAPTKNKNIWVVGDLKPSQTGIIKIKGIIRGSNLESKIFRAVLGFQQGDGEQILPYDETSESVTLRAPFMEAAILANGQNTYVSYPGDTISIDLKLKNNLPAEVKNASLEAKMEGAGNPIDIGSIRVEGGSYRDSSKSVLWTASTHEKFKVLAPEEEDSVSFSFKIKSQLPLSGDSARPSVKITVIFKPGAGEVPGFEGVDVSGQSSYDVKISSKLQIISRALYSSSPMPNTGPLPPKVGEETTYTVVWSLANMVNDLDNVVVKSSLPPYMSFKNALLPGDADVSFDKASGEIIWKAGRVLAGTGFLRPATQIAFQVGLTPSPNQADTVPVIINEVSASGRDTFTNQILFSSDEQITTDLPDDPNVTLNQKRVVP
ncbi:MAG: hypothetical protein HYW15_03745 [Candidatus Giovannonibacteria bacterium]|nr:MAG: hypothetical protein HYW15_03745 [Candidatus Giovannonibacteria bacterium]